MTKKDSEVILKLAEVIVDLQKQLIASRIHTERELKIQRRYHKALNAAVLLRDRRCMNSDCSEEDSSIYPVQIEENGNDHIWNYITLCGNCCSEFEHSKVDIEKYYRILEKEYKYDYDNENFFLLSEEHKKIASLL